MLYAFLLYGIFLSLKDIVRAPKTYVLGALYGGVGGIRTLGPLNTATRFPVVLVMTASIPLQISAVTRQVSVCSEQLSYHTRNLPDCQVFFAETGNKNHSPKAFASGLQGTSVQLARGFENKREKLLASVALFC